MNNVETDVMLSIVVPCRNEESHIAECLDSLIAAELPEGKIEVLVVDGMSEDGTKALLSSYSKAHPFIRICSNPQRITPVGLNIGVRESRGKYIMILSSHSNVEKDFLSKNIAAISKCTADCVGGIVRTLPGDSTITAQSIAVAMSEPFGVGSAYFRIGVKHPLYVDTVPFGCYRRDVFDRIGLFDEDLVRNQDDEYNLRLVKRGGKILLDPCIVSHYYARDSLSKLWHMMFQYGYFKPLVATKVKGILTWRQLVPALFVVGLAASGLVAVATSLRWPFFIALLLYAAAGAVASSFAAFKKGRWYLLALPVVFSTMHFAYGIGYIKGFWDFLVVEKQKRSTLHDVPLTR